MSMGRPRRKRRDRWALRSSSHRTDPATMRSLLKISGGALEANTPPYRAKPDHFPLGSSHRVSRACLLPNGKAYEVLSWLTSQCIHKFGFPTKLCLQQRKTTFATCLSQDFGSTQTVRGILYDSANSPYIPIAMQALSRPLTRFLARRPTSFASPWAAFLPLSIGALPQRLASVADPPSSTAVSGADFIATAKGSENAKGPL
jgi:hypothetical protein